MASTMRVRTGLTAVFRGMREHLLLSVIVVCVLLGGGLRLVASNDATAAGSTGDEAPAATACAATQ